MCNARADGLTYHDACRCAGGICCGGHLVFTPAYQMPAAWPPGPCPPSRHPVWHLTMAAIP